MLPERGSLGKIFRGMRRKKELRLRRKRRRQRWSEASKS